MLGCLAAGYGTAGATWAQRYATRAAMGGATSYRAQPLLCVLAGLATVVGPALGSEYNTVTHVALGLKLPRYDNASMLFQIWTSGLIWPFCPGCTRASRHCGCFNLMWLVSVRAIPLKIL